MARTTNLWRMIRQLTTEEQLKKVIEAVEARRREIVEGVKRCSACQDFLPRSSFRPHSHSSDGLLSQCRTCERREKTKRNSPKGADYAEWVLRDVNE